MTNKFKYFDTTADIGIKVTSNNIEKAFENSALATLNLITDIEKIKPEITKKITLTSEDEYGLLYDWITELLILLDSENFMASQYNIKITEKENEYLLTGKIMGDTYDTTIYNYKTEVKAITYHEMNIEKKEDQIKIKFIVDL
ncbi:MAG: archease [Methanosphaera sp.]|uniref:archease n=1 Tax=Methanosphaera sp. ISO3-F5 TaxID=1452353 RepID=UPI002B263C73|nr:archease [Methanosphaera sp. ISO3-F5]MBR0471464.1 archease [Methanosphaera sp.]WQH63308.1 archease [Methanosphaera sp. ISO3-F5]